MRARVASKADRQKLLQYAEKAALVFEELGLPRMAGRVIGWLLVCEPAHQSLTELAETLQASKASISTSTRMLVQFGVIEKVSLPGDRRDYVRIKPEAWSQAMQKFERETRMVLELARDGLAILGEAPRERRERLEELHDVYDFLRGLAPKLEEAWQHAQARKKR